MGSFLCCIYCGRVSVVDDTGTRLPTEEEWERICDNQDVLRFMDAWMRLALGEGPERLPSPESRGGRPRPKMIGPGFFDDNGELHVDLVLVCVHQGVKPTAANQDVAARRIEAAAAERHLPVERDSHSGRW